MNKAVSFILGSICTVVGLVLLGTVAADIIFSSYDIYDQATWPTTNATVTYSNITIYTQNCDLEDPLCAPVIYHPNIGYNYSFNSSHYGGSCCSDIMPENEKSARQLIEKYPVGKPVVVVVKPNSPWVSRFKDDTKPLLSYFRLILGLFGIALLISGLELLVPSLK